MILLSSGLVAKLNDNKQMTDLCDRRFAGIEQAEEFCEMSKARREELEDVSVRANLRRHIADLKVLGEGNSQDLFVKEDYVTYGYLPFDTKPIAEK